MNAAILKQPSRAAMTLALAVAVGAPVQAQPTSPANQDVPAVDNAPVSVPDQVAEQTAQATTQDAGDIIVTASRVQRDGFTAPTPTTIIGEGLIEARGATNVAVVLNEIPAFKASTTPQTNGVRAVQAGSYFADLRGLGANRTLVLVDGNRFVPQISTGLQGYQVDLNQVPALLLERAEVVTGGASAQWGSDAVAGVVNLVLKKNFEGLNAEAQYGISEEGDNEEYRVGLIAGVKLGERGNLTVAFDHTDNGGVGDVYTRDWGRRGFGLVTNPSRAANGLAATLILPDVRYSTATNGGIITNVTGPAAQLRGIQFGPGGALSQFQYGQYVGASFMQGGGSNQGLNFNTGVSIAGSVKRYIGYTRASYELFDGFDVYAEGSYADTRGRAQTLPARNEQVTPIVITLDNPFIPAALRTEIARLNALPQNATNQITSFNLGRNSVDIGNQRSRIDNRTIRGVAGFRTKIGTWNANGAVIYGENRYDQNVYRNRNQQRFRFAADVVQTATGPACRAVVQGNPLATGCVPINLFGDGSPSAAAGDYVTGTTVSRTDYGQFAANLNVDGQVFETWAGPVSLAGGLEYRREEQDTTIDPVSEAAGFESSNARALAGDFNVKEAYLETVIPLARDWTLLQSFDVQAAVRFTDYSTVGGVTTWKVGATWQPIDGLLVRGTISRDIRAPNIFELTTPAVSTILTRLFTAGVNGGPAGQVATENLTRGNADLDPEKSKTKTLGVSYAPPFVPGLQLSVDYFDIKVSGAVQVLDPNITINFCTGATPTTADQRAYYCSFIRANPAGSLSAYTVDNPFLNLSEVRRRGYDLEASYRMPLQRLSDGLGGAVTLRFSGTKFNRFGDNVNNAGFIDRAGETSANGNPKFITNSSVTYDDDVVTAQLQMRTIGKGRYNNLFTEGVQINDNSVAGRTYLNASLNLRLVEKFELFGVVNNLTDRDPPLVPQNFGYPTVPAFFDMIGRSYRVGVRYKM